MVSVIDVLTRVKRTFGDEAAVQVTQADIIRWINDAQREAVMQNEGLLQKVGFVSSVAGTKEYTYPTDLFVLHHLYYKASASEAYYALKYLSLKDFSEYVDGWDGTTMQGIPLIYTQQEDGKTVIFPTPAASVANGIKLIYSRYATDVVDQTSTIDLPPFLHTYVINFCLMQAYEMDEDWESAGNKATQIQGDLDFNNNRKFWFGRETYPTISVSYNDQD
jgi:hypothetical protein